MLTDVLRNHLTVHGVPDELSSDGGPEYVAAETQMFLKRWGVRHRVSSVAFPHSNLRAELGVKVMKRMMRENLSSDGELSMDKMGRALLAYRNMPCRDLGLSPAQILFGRKLRDHLLVPIEELVQRK